MEGKILRQLREREFLHMGMIVPILRGSAEVLYAGSDGVFIKEQASGAYMLSLCDFERGVKLLDGIEGKNIFCVHQPKIAEYLLKKHNFSHYLECFQAVYMDKSLVSLAKTDMQIRTLNTKDFDSIVAHMNTDTEKGYLESRIEAGACYGGFIDEHMCGYVGIHEEGSIGLLEVFDEYKKRGLGSVLFGYATNQVLLKGGIPFSQIAVDNTPSMRLHQRLGYRLSEEKLYWLF